MGRFLISCLIRLKLTTFKIFPSDHVAQYVLLVIRHLSQFTKPQIFCLKFPSLLVRSSSSFPFSCLLYFIPNDMTASPLNYKIMTISIHSIQQVVKRTNQIEVE